MNIAVETLSPTRVKLTVEVDPEELKPYLDEAFKAIAARIAVPGFRPGKVPARIIEQRVGRGAVLQDAVNSALPELYSQAVEENALRPMSQPEVDITEMPLEDDQKFVFTAELDVRPELDLPEFSTMTIKVDGVDEAAIEEAAEERLTSLRERFGTLNGVERPAADGDFVSIDLHAEVDGEEIDTVKGVSYEIGSASMLEGMDVALTGLSAGESTTFTAPLAGGDRAGEDAEITLTLNSVKERELPALDDDFAQLASEFDTLEELQADIRTQAQQAKTFEQGVMARDALLEMLLDQIEIPVPQGAVDAEAHNHLEGQERLDDDEHRAEVVEQSRKTLQARILLDAIADEENVEVTQQELIEFMIVSAQTYGVEPGEFARALDENKGIPALAAEVARRKALARILEKVTVKDSNGEVLDLNRLVESDEPEDEVAEEDVDATVDVDAEAEEDDTDSDTDSEPTG